MTVSDRETQESGRKVSVQPIQGHGLASQGSSSNPSMLRGDLKVGMEECNHVIQGVQQTAQNEVQAFVLAAQQAVARHQKDIQEKSEKRKAAEDQLMKLRQGCQRALQDQNQNFECQAHTWKQLQEICEHKSQAPN